LDTEYGITHKEREHANGVFIDPIALKETLAKDFDIRPDDDQTCLIDLEK
jgi:hypothetical protein